MFTECESAGVVAAQDTTGINLLQIILVEAKKACIHLIQCYAPEVFPRQNKVALNAGGWTMDRCSLCSLNFNGCVGVKM